MRKQFEIGKYYHICNRGVDKRKIFMDEKDFVRFLRSMREFNNINPIESLRRLKQIRKAETEVELLSVSTDRSSTSVSAPATQPLVKIICYCQNPNHYHILVEQLVEKGIQKFMHKLSTGYTKYFNQKYNCSGSLFQGRYNATPIKTTGFLQKVSCYINGNPEIHKIVANAEDWIYSSYQDYLGLRDGKLCNKEAILKDFQNIEEYKKLACVIIKESIEKKLALKLDSGDEEKKWMLE